MVIKRETDNTEMTTRNTPNAALESRVGKLEGTMETLAQEVRVTNQNMQKISDSFSLFREDLLSKIGTITTPKWPMIFSAVTLLVTILGLGGTIIALMISGEKEAVKTHDLQLIEVQRNINLDKIEQTKANTHIDALVNTLNDEHKATQDLVTDLKQWRLIHTDNEGKFVGDLTARINILEKSVDILEKRQYNHEQDISNINRSKTTH